jgi:hypothetical protein
MFLAVYRTISRSRAFLEKLTVGQLICKFSLLSWNLKVYYHEEH